MSIELQRPPQARQPVQVSGNVTTAVLVATAAADDGGPAAGLPWEGGTVLDRLLAQMAELGLQSIHVLTRPEFEDVLRPVAERGGATLHICAGASEDLAQIAELARTASGGFVVALAETIVQRGALEGLLASPGLVSGVLGGSMAQREVLEDTLIYALASSGQNERAAEVLDRRLSRRHSPLDARRRAALMPAAVDGSGGTAT